MARQTEKLTEEQCYRASIDRERTILGDGGGLYLRRFPTSYSWIFVWNEAGKRREMGLGGYGNKVSLAEARERANRARHLIAAGFDPAGEMSKKRQLNHRTTFAQLVRIYVKKASRGTFSNNLRTDYCNMLLRCFRAIKNMMLSEITDDHLQSAIKSIEQNVGLVDLIKYRLRNIFRWGEWNGYQINPEMKSILV